MKRPEAPPEISLEGMATALAKVMPHAPELQKLLHKTSAKYLPWQKFKYQAIPEGLSSQDVWAYVKFERMSGRVALPLTSIQGDQFTLQVTNEMHRLLRTVDMQAGGSLLSLEDKTNINELLNTESRSRFMVSSLMEEAIASSQIEGASTTRRIAKEMLSSGRKPVDISERMIVNNYATMRALKGMVSEPISPELLREIQAMLTEGTLRHPEDVGSFRTDADGIEVGDDADGSTLFVPPDEKTVHRELPKLCAYADEDDKEFIHPVVKAIILHFWLAYLHPFPDGNGRTARALFYLYLLKNGYWAIEYMSISSAIKKRRADYDRSYLYVEDDNNDLGYFVLFNLECLETSLKQLQSYIERKSQAMQRHRYAISAYRQLNARQKAVLTTALEKPATTFSIEVHQRKYEIAYATARSDLLELEKAGLLTKEKAGRAFVFRGSQTLFESAN